ncbi:cytoskeletal protein RodZ [Catenuloplanes nepalensis]|uniref:Cytoskeletal protein RodZ n=1 Tax=Catenuloplanes nepalensis TaxID=587533 RepID=A0ABT9MPU6_9ACTN|nr:hypothetical protein [Catenuloplanes nepalensis]MDP9793323.1 cytoskeletal protein RodZ [Catenuloplanes nepalensis]
MDDLDRLLAETMHDAAGRAPSDDGLLRGVHHRSRAIHRRRVLTGVSAVAAVALVAVGVPFMSVLATRPEPVVPPAATAPAVPPSPTASATASPTPSAAPPSSGPPASPAPPPPRSEAPASTAVTLAEGWTAPVFPYTLPAAEDRRTPVATMNDGDLIGFFETTDPQHEADITVTVSGAEPPDGAGSETARRVRGRDGTLRTVEQQPARQLALTWQESPSRWITLATDDTYTPDEVVAWADGLSAGSIEVQPPFQLDLSPARLTTTTVTASRMIFSSPGTGGISLILQDRTPLSGANQTVGGYSAALTRDGDIARLAIDVRDWDATLEITVGDGLTISDADLLRFGAAVTLLTRSNPE